MRLPLTIACLLLVAAAPASSAPDPALGRWVSHEASNGSASVVELYLEQGRLSGRVLSVTDAQGRPLRTRCDGCAGALKGQPIPGLRFLWDLKPKSGRWVNGRVIDLRAGVSQGVEATADLHVLGDELYFRAYLGLPALGQLRIWKRQAGARNRGTDRAEEFTE